MPGQRSRCLFLLWVCVVLTLPAAGSQSAQRMTSAKIVTPDQKVTPDQRMTSDEIVSSSRPGRMTSSNWTCPALCQCSKDGTTVNCEGKRLTAVPDGIPVTVERLFLDHNNLAELTPGSLTSLPRLSKVYLRNSQIQTLQPAALSRLPRLTELYLTNNKLAALDPRAFLEVNSLSLLNLGANKLTAVPDLQSLPRLSKLYMEGNMIRNASFPAGYVTLTGLTNIVMSNNNISVISNQTFAALSNSSVTRLDLARNSIRDVSTAALRPLHNLKSLQIGLNPLNGVQLQNMLLGLGDDVNLESLDIRQIALGGSLPSVSFSLLSHTRLSVLIFKNNKLLTIPPRAFSHLPNLVQLDLSSCQVQNVSRDAFLDLPDLQTLVLSHNGDLTTVPTNLPASLVKLYLQYSGLTTLRSGDFANLRQLRELYMSNNKIHEVSEDSFMGLVNLRILHLQNNLLSYIPKALFAPLTNLLELNLKNNNLKTLKTNPGALSSLKSLTSLDMSDNQCSYLPYTYLSDLTSLQTLNLHGNNLNHAIAGDTEGVLLSNMKNLLTLNLASNNLQYIHDAQFSNLAQLKHLHLQDNQLSCWGPSLFSTPGKTLLSLDLSSNQIALVNETSVRDLQHVRSLNLSLNPFACTCDLRWFRSWLNSTTALVLNNRTYKCNSPPAWNGVPLMEFGADKIDCRDWTWVYVGVSIAATFLVALVVCLVIYRQRWFIRLRFYRLRRALSRACCSGRAGRGGYQEIEGQEFPPLKRYDFYVIAAEEDTRWVMEKLLPRLDAGHSAGCTGRFTLYYEGRDAVPGTKIANMEHALHAARAVLVVLTQHLKDESWCRFLLDVALQMKIEGEIERVEVIKVGRVTEDRVPKCLHKAMARNEFRDWPDRDRVEQDFVEHLENVLGRGQGAGQGQEAGQGQGGVQGHDADQGQGMINVVDV